MLTSLLAAALAVQAAPSNPASMSNPITQENRALLRCAAAFAVVSSAQAKGDAQALQWPDLGTRGREFFVRAMAQLMDASGIDREGIARLASAEARTLSDNSEVGQIMPSCLLMLESSGI